MAFFCYEMAKRPDYQIRLQDEIDTFFSLNGYRDVEYQDLKQFKFLSRCWTEILRLWPAIPNGTFRQLQYDDYIAGSNGEEVKLPKGIYVQITNWVKHRSKLLWGQDADKFNPDKNLKIMNYGIMKILQHIIHIVIDLVLLHILQDRLVKILHK